MNDDSKVFWLVGRHVACQMRFNEVAAAWQSFAEDSDEWLEALGKMDALVREMDSLAGELRRLGVGKRPGVIACKAALGYVYGCRVEDAGAACVPMGN